MKSRSKKVLILSLIVFSVIAILVVLYIFKQKDDNGTDNALEDVRQSQEATTYVSVEITPEPAASPTEKPYSHFDGMVRIGEYLDITISDDARIEELPGEINIYDSQPMYIDDETGAKFIANLEDNDWHGHIFESTDIEGLYFIGTKENSEIITSTEVYVESAREFMQVSGLIDFFEREGIELMEEIQGEGKNCTVFYWLMVVGQKTGGYVRINVESGNNCIECKMALLRSTVYKTLPSVSLEEAVDNAYGKFGDDYEGLEFTLVSAKLQYIEGIPYYDITLTGEEILTCLMLNAPAISLDELIAEYYMRNTHVVLESK